MYYTIYRTTNTLNGKIYVGMHKTKDLDDGYLGSGKVIKNSVSKYGKEIFPTALKYNGYWDNDTNFDLLYYYGPFSKGVTAFDWAHENIDKAPVNKLLDVYIKGK